MGWKKKYCSELTRVNIYFFFAKIINPRYLGIIRVGVKVLSQYLPGGTKENHKKHKSRELVSGARFEPGTSQI
jgi:hypothetical protein